MSKRKSFIIHHDSLDVIDKLTDEQAGKLLKAIKAYQLGQEYEADLTTDLVFTPFKAQFKRDEEKYQKIVERNKNNGLKGGRPQTQNNPEEPKKPSGLSGNPEEPKKADSDSESKSESKSDSESKEQNYTSAIANCPHDEIIALYHNILPANPRVKVWNDTRKGYLRSRWREDESRQDLSWWERFFTYISKSAFLTGRVDQSQRKPFIADLEWIVKPSNFVKIIEGKYES